MADRPERASGADGASTPVPADQAWFHSPEMQARIARAEADIREGRVVRTHTPDEAQALLDSLKTASGATGRSGESA